MIVCKNVHDQLTKIQTRVHTLAWISTAAIGVLQWVPMQGDLDGINQLQIKLDPNSNHLQRIKAGTNPLTIRGE